MRPSGSTTPKTLRPWFVVPRQIPSGIGAAVGGGGVGGSRGIVGGLLGGFVGGLVGGFVGGFGLVGGFVGGSVGGVVGGSFGGLGSGVVGSFTACCGAIGSCPSPPLQLDKLKSSNPIPSDRSMVFVVMIRSSFTVK